MNKESINKILKSKLFWKGTVATVSCSGAVCLFMAILEGGKHIGVNTKNAEYELKLSNKEAEITKQKTQHGEKVEAYEVEKNELIRDIDGLKHWTTQFINNTEILQNRNQKQIETLLDTNSTISRAYGELHRDYEWVVNRYNKQRTDWSNYKTRINNRVSKIENLIKGRLDNMRSILSQNRGELVTKLNEVLKALEQIKNEK